MGISSEIIMCKLATSNMVKIPCGIQTLWILTVRIQTFMEWWPFSKDYWLVVSTPLKHISQLGLLFPINPTNLIMAHMVTPKWISWIPRKHEVDTVVDPSGEPNGTDLHNNLAKTADSGLRGFDWTCSENYEHPMVNLCRSHCPIYFNSMR